MGRGLHELTVSIVMRCVPESLCEVFDASDARCVDCVVELAAAVKEGLLLRQDSKANVEPQWEAAGRGRRRRGR